MLCRCSSDNDENYVYQYSQYAQCCESIMINSMTILNCHHALNNICLFFWNTAQNAGQYLKQLRKQIVSYFNCRCGPSGRSWLAVACLRAAVGEPLSASGPQLACRCRFCRSRRTASGLRADFGLPLLALPQWALRRCRLAAAHMRIS